MSELVSSGLVPAFEMLTASVAAGARTILGHNRPENPIMEGTRACWKVAPHDSLVHLMLATWQATCAWMYESNDAEEVRSVSELYYLMRGRPGEELIPACERLMGALGRYGMNAFVAQYTDGGVKYYRIASDTTLVQTFWDSAELHPCIPRFTARMQEFLHPIRIQRNAEKAASESWHRDRIVG